MFMLYLQIRIVSISKQSFFDSFLQDGVAVTTLQSCSSIFNFKQSSSDQHYLLSGMGNEAGQEVREFIRNEPNLGMGEKLESGIDVTHYVHFHSHT